MRAALALAVALLMSLVTSAKAQAECMNPEACYNAATWQRAVAQNYFSEGVWFREHSRQYFVYAAEWNQKATFAFHAGDATAALWYKALADDYSRKSVANAKAADERFAQAAFTSAAADGNVRRGMNLTVFFYRGPSAAEDNADAQGAGVDPDPTTVPAGTTAPRRCKNPANREWSGGGIHVYVYVENFCWRKPREVTDVDLSFESDVTGFADAQISEDGCHEERWWYNWDLLGAHSGRKVLVTCRFDAKPAGIVPITIGTMTCRVALYFHGNGSYAYTKQDKMRCDNDYF